MSTAALERLMFTVGMQDNTSRSINRLNRNIDGISDQAKVTSADIAGTAAAMVGSIAGITATLSLAFDLNRALGDMKVLGVVGDDLAQLEKAAFSFGNQYALSATEFIQSSLKMKKMFGELSGDELEKLTEKSQLLAISTKTDVDDTTRLISQMWQKFGKSSGLGKVSFADNMVKQMATVNKAVGTDVVELTDAMEGLSNLGVTMGVSMTEQMGTMAWFGKKASNMGDAEAFYLQFLEKARPAQDALGVSFFDDNTNKLLPIIKIADNLKKKFGSLSEENLWGKLNEQLGDSANIFMDIFKDSKSLQQLFNKMGKDTKLNPNIDSLHRLLNSLNNLNSGFYQSTVQALTPYLNSAADITGTLSKWTIMFPHLTGAIGTLTTVILGIVAAVSTWNLAGLAFAFMFGQTTAAMLTMVKVINLMKLSLIWLRGAALGAYLQIMMVSGVMKTLMVLKTAFLWVRGAMAGVMVQMQLMAIGGFPGIIAGLSAFTSSIWASTVALLANPLVWIPALIVGVVAAVGALIYYWNDLKAAFMDSSWGKIIISTINSVFGWFSKLGGAFAWLGEKMGLLSPDYVKVDAKIDSATTQKSDVPAGGVVMKTNNISNNSASTNINYGGVVVNASNGFSPAHFEEWSVIQGA